MLKTRIAIPDDCPPVMGPSEAYRKRLAQADVRYFDSLPQTSEELVERIKDADVVISIRASVPFPEEVLAACPNLKILSIWGTGTDHVDLEAATRLGITVTNTRGVTTVSMAEHTLTLMLAAARHIPQIDLEVKQGCWPRGFVTQLHGKTLGVIGLGAIGGQTARIAQGIGMRVVAWTMHPSEALARELGVQLVELDDLYRQSDVISVHLRLSSDTMNMIGEREFRLMKSSALLINTARGAIVDENALLAALREQRIAGAGLDVFVNEPLPKDHALTRLPNVVLTPHAGGVTREALEASLLLSIENIFSNLAGIPANVVQPPMDGHGRSLATRGSNL